MIMSKPICIVIVNWNSGPLLSRCVTSIQAYHLNLVENVVIVDNSSTDESLEFVERAGEEPVPTLLIKNSVNRGFAAACNQGAALAQSDYLLFLNPDAELMPESLHGPLSYIREPCHSDVGIVGIQLESEDGTVARSCARFPTPARFMAYSVGISNIPAFRSFGVAMTDWAHDVTMSVDHIMGAFFLIRHSVFRAANGFDERFFVYFEDVDLSARVSQLGYRSVYLAESRARHIGGGSSRKIKARRLYYSIQSRILYGSKHFGLVGRILAATVTLTVEPIVRLIVAALKGSGEDVRNTLSAFQMVYTSLPLTMARVRRR